MFRPKLAWRSVAVLGAAALALAACGDDGDDGAGGDVPEGDGVLKIGTILPQTGSLAILGPPEFAGVDLAVQEINEAGGVLGEDVEVFHEDSGDTSTDIASISADSLIGEGVDAIIGSASSGVSFQFIDKLYEEGIVQVSPANTSPKFSTYEKGDYYFRTAPSDVLQGRVLADLVAADGNANLAILALNDAYGTGLADNVEASFTEGGGEVLLKTIYDPQAAEFTAEVAAVEEADPDAIVLITFDEIRKLAPELVNAGLGPDVKKWYFVDGNLSNYGEDFPKGMLDGTKGTLPGAEVTSEFQERLLAADPNLKDFSYAPESYDATILVALAAVAAGSDHPDAIKDNMAKVSKDGEECTSFAECKDLLEAGSDIDYQGVSGPVEWDDVGDVTAATIGIYQYKPDNTYANLDYLFGEL